MDNIYFMDPSTLANYTYVPIDEFLDRWHDWDGDKKVRHLGIAIWKKGKPEFREQVIRRMP